MDSGTLTLLSIHYNPHFQAVLVTKIGLCLSVLMSMPYHLRMETLSRAPLCLARRHPCQFQPSQLANPPSPPRIPRTYYFLCLLLYKYQTLSGHKRVGRQFNVVEEFLARAGYPPFRHLTWKLSKSLQPSPRLLVKPLPTTNLQ